MVYGTPAAVTVERGFGRSRKRVSDRNSHQIKARVGAVLLLKALMAPA
jgi:hypothetical protein